MDLALAKRRAVRRDAKTASGGAAEMDADMSHRAAGAARERAWGEESRGNGGCGLRFPLLVAGGADGLCLLIKWAGPTRKFFF